MKYIGPLAFVVILALIFESWTVFIIGIVIVVMMISSDDRENRKNDHKEDTIYYDITPSAGTTETIVSNTSFDDDDLALTDPALYKTGRKYYLELLDRRRKWQKKYKEYQDSLSFITRRTALSYEEYVAKNYHIDTVLDLEYIDFDDPDKVDGLDFVSDELEIYDEELEKYGLDYYSDLYYDDDSEYWDDEEDGYRDYDPDDDFDFDRDDYEGDDDDDRDW
ncbi:MAG: hypothetical protein K2K47_02945 [Duncaniella sp.]|nr:hypothetical protein [Duncaniella sp.]